MKKILVFSFFILMFFSCKDELVDNPNPVPVPVKLFDKYCALGASTATFNWQKMAAGDLSNYYCCYAIGGSRWIHTSGTSLDYSANASGKADNCVMTNQLARLIRDKQEKGYKPDVITLLCGLNDAAYSTIRPIEGNWSESISLDVSNISLEDWFSLPAYKSLRENLCGSVKYVLEKLIKEFPNSIIIIILPQQAYNGTYTNERVEKVNNVIVRVASRYNIPIIDMFHDSKIILDQNNKSPYLRPDGIHPNAQGEQLLYELVVDQVEKIYRTQRIVK